jgi:hypothetical protein
MATVLKIYQTKITPSLNARVDLIDKYLLSCGSRYTDNNFQFVKPQLDVTLVLDVSGDSSFSPYVEKGNLSIYPVLGNYLTLDLDTGSNTAVITKRFYYFILEAKWVSDNSVALKCSLDTINTFWNDFVWSDKTSIKRQHMNRFTNSEAIGTLTAPKTINFLIDKNSEGIAPAQMYKTSQSEFKQSGLAHKDWFLLYKTTDAALSNATGGSSSGSNGLSCFLVPELDTLVSQATTTALTYPMYDNMQTEKTYYVQGGSGSTITFYEGDYGDPGATFENKPSGFGADPYLNDISIKIGDSFSTTDGVMLTCICGAYFRMHITITNIDVVAPIGVYTDSSGTNFYFGFFAKDYRFMLTRKASGNAFVYMSDAIMTYYTSFSSSGTVMSTNLDHLVDTFYYGLPVGT